MSHFYVLQLTTNLDNSDLIPHQHTLIKPFFTNGFKRKFWQYHYFLEFFIFIYFRNFFAKLYNGSFLTESSVTPSEQLCSITCCISLVHHMFEISCDIFRRSEKIAQNFHIVILWHRYLILARVMRIHTPKSRPSAFGLCLNLKKSRGRVRLTLIQAKCHHRT